MSDELKVVGVAEIYAVTKIGKDTIREAFKSGELEGNLIGGSRGFVTTMAAVRRWVEGKGTRNSDDQAAE